MYVGCVHNPVLKETLVLSGMLLIFIMPVIQILYPVFFLPLLRRRLHLDAACLVNEKTRLLWVGYGQPGRYGTYVALRRILSVYLVFVFWSVFAVWSVTRVRLIHVDCRLMSGSYLWMVMHASDPLMLAGGCLSFIFGKVWFLSPLHCGFDELDGVSFC